MISGQPVAVLYVDLYARPGNPYQDAAGKPWADAAECKHEYGLDLIGAPEAGASAKAAISTATMPATIALTASSSRMSQTRGSALPPAFSISSAAL